MDVLALVAYLQRLPVVPLALTNLAGHIDVGQEVHLDLQQAVAGAGLAPPAPDVEGEPARAVAPGFCVLSGGEQLPDVVEQPRVGGGVGPGCAPDGGLVDGDDLVQKLNAVHAVVLSRAGFGAVQLRAQALVKNLVDQGGLARPGHAGDGDEGPQGKVHVDVPQVVFRRSAHGEGAAAARPALRRDRHLPPPRQIVAGDGARGVHDLLGGAAGHHLPTVDPRAGADVHDVVGGAHGVLVVLHHDESIPQIAQMLQRPQQQVVVPLVQADGRFVQNIQHPHQRGADLGGQPDALALAAGQGACLTGQGQVLQTHRPQEAQPGADFLEDLVGDHALGLGEGDGIQKCQGLVHRLLAELVDGAAPHGDRQGFPLEPFALTGGAGALAHALLNLPLHGVGLGLPVAALQVVYDALKGLVQRALAPRLVVIQGQLFPLGAIENDVHHLAGQLFHRVGELELVLF